MCSSPTERNISAVFREVWCETAAHLQLELFPHSILLIGLYDDMEIVQVFDNEVVPLVHGQEDLLDRGITWRRCAVFSF